MSNEQEELTPLPNIFIVNFFVRGVLLFAANLALCKGVAGNFERRSHSSTQSELEKKKIYLGRPIIHCRLFGCVLVKNELIVWVLHKMACLGQ